MRKAVLGAAAVLLLAIPASQAFAHCQIPCGIYDDQMRFSMIAEHITTVEKAMAMIRTLSAGGPDDRHQLVRWIVNKEEHAQEIQDIVARYFLAQRLKPATTEDEHAFSDYTHKLTLLHGMIVTAMKAKQTTDAAHVARLRDLLAEFQDAYSGHGHTH